MTIAVSGQNPASGLSGRLAVAQGGFMMVGGYCSGLLVSGAGAPPLVAVAAGFVVGLVLGAVIGTSIIRLSGIYLGIITLQFTLAVPELAKAWTGLTGGELGIVLPPLEAAGLAAVSPYAVWIASVVVTVLALGVLAWLSRARLDAGVNVIDTADVYSQGESEEIVGHAIKGKRDRIVLASKFHGRLGNDVNRGGNSRRWLTSAVEESLRRLCTDHLDLYQVHRPDPHTDLGETLGALSDLVRAGKIRYFGTSTFGCCGTPASHRSSSGPARSISSTSSCRHRASRSTTT